ncbi:BatD family protein [Spirosoma luteum]|uniref:BatD family protein n=1 Tax=Spirosoma luteum TaxID=431553 RepID=UPI00037C7912|nr:BatD family protein [Spirosoma luteum]
MLVAIFRNFFALFFLSTLTNFGQVPDNTLSIELGVLTFPLERPFTISVTIPNAEKRVSVSFPDINGFDKKGISTSVAPAEIDGKTVTSQIITQTYQARATGRFRLLPFTIAIDGESIYSDGATLVVQPSESTTAPQNNTLALAEAASGNAAFLSLRTSQSTIYAGEGVALTLSFFVSDNYPYELSFTALDRQLQAITKRIRPANSWEENMAITELKPIPVLIRGKKFREYRIFQSVFFPLSNQNLKLPAVSLHLARPKPVIGPPTSQPETVVFTSRPMAIVVKPLPAHPLSGRVPVGSFQLEEGLERQEVNVGQSVRYTFTITGEGNIATLPAPALVNQVPDFDVFPPEERHTVVQNGNQVTGHKTFTYFIVPHQNGLISLANHFQWIYFDPRTARYDTIQPHVDLLVGGKKTTTGTMVLIPGTQADADAPAANSLYTGIEAMDSTQQPVSISTLVRSIANVLILVMLLGILVVFFKK